MDWIGRRLGGVRGEDLVRGMRVEGLGWGVGGCCGSWVFMY